MDVMIDLFVDLYQKHKTFSQNEIETIAGYLVEKEPFSAAAAALTPLPQLHLRTFHTHVHQIVTACRQDPALLPRLGRFLHLLDQVGSQLSDIVLTQSMDKGLGSTSLFAATGLGDGRHLGYLSRSGPYKWKGRGRSVLEEIYGRDPAILEEYLAESKDSIRICVAAFLVGKDPVRFNKQIPLLQSEALLGCAAAAHAWGGGVADRLYPQLGLKEKVQYGAYSVGGNRRASQNNVYFLFSALDISGWNIPELNRLMKKLCVAAPEKFVDQLLRCTRDDVQNINLYIGCNNKEDGKHSQRRDDLKRMLGELDVFMGKLEVPEEALCAVHARQMAYCPVTWSPIFRERYGDDPALLKRAQEYAHPLAKMMLDRLLLDLGEAVEVQALELRAVDFLRAMHSDPKQETSVEQVIHWLLGKSGATVEELSPLGDHFHNRYCYSISPPEFDLDAAMGILHGISEVPKRYIGYLAHIQAPHRLFFQIRLLAAHLGGEAAAAAYLLAAAPPASILATAADNQDWAVGCEKPVLVEILRQNPQAVASAMAKAGAAGRVYLLDTLYDHCPSAEPALLLQSLGDSSKQVRQHAVSHLLPRKELAEQVRPLLEAKKKAVREAAEQLMLAYEGAGAAPAGEEDSSSVNISAYCARNLPKNAARSIAWARVEELPPIHWADSPEVADETTVLCYLYLFLSQKSMEIPAAALKIRPYLREEDLRATAEQVFQGWVQEGSSTKTKGALLFYGVHADDAGVLALQKQIDAWAGSSRGAIAAEGVWAMALGGSDLALMTVDSIGRKFKNKQVRRAGVEAFAGIAKALGESPEVLGDRIIPTLGFDGRGEKVIDYGARAFTATLSPSLTIQLTDAGGKTIKSLPKPGAKDDADIAQRAKAEFTALKKSLKAVVSTQSARLEAALSSSRKWDKSAWEKLFVHNPIMHCFAIGLIWGAYDDETLGDTFRYMEDGSFTTADEEDFSLEGLGERRIGLVHPLELEENQLKQWAAQLEDYEITQPIPQIHRPVYRLEPQEQKSLVLERFGGKVLLGITLVGKLQKMGWYRGSVQDGGGFSTFYKENAGAGVGVQLNFDYMYVSPDPTEETTIGQAAFYQAGSVRRGSYVYDDVSGERVIPLAEVPPRLLSEIIYDLTQATATSTRSDGGWKGDNVLVFPFAK